MDEEQLDLLVPQARINKEEQSLIGTGIYIVTVSNPCKIGDPIYDSNGNIIGTALSSSDKDSYCKVHING